MSEDEDDTPPEALFFTQRALKFPIPAEPVTDFDDISKLIEEAEETEKPAKKAKDTKQFKGRTTRGRKRLMENVEETEPPKDLDEFDDSPKKDAEFQSPDVSSFAPAVKKRLKQIHTRQANELKKIVAENSKILSAATIPAYIEEGGDHAVEEIPDFILTISYITEVSRLKCSRDEKFISIFPKVADLFNLKASEFLLCFNNCSINLDDTPETLNLTFSDIIECLPYKGKEAVDKKSEDTLKILFQSENSREKVHLFVHKLESMQDIMQKYSELKNVPVEGLVFEFDGEKIQGSETPLDLDMESGNCIDVKTVTKPAEALKNIPSSSFSKQTKAAMSSILSYFVQIPSNNPEPANSVDSDIIFIE